MFSHTLGNTYVYLPFGHFLTCNMIFMAGMSVLLAALSMWKLRVRRERVPGRSRRHA